jgi:hypothetical protein
MKIVSNALRNCVQEQALRAGIVLFPPEHWDLQDTFGTFGGSVEARACKANRVETDFTQKVIVRTCFIVAS